MNLREELLQAHSEGKFLDAVFKCSLGTGDRRAEVSSELAALHNEGLVDIVAAFEALKKDSTSQPDFFLTRHIFETALPQISAATPAVMRCVLHLVREAGQDLAAGTIIESYIRFCERSQTRPYDAVKQIENEPAAFAVLLPTTIAAGATFDAEHFADEAIRFCGGNSLELRQQALISFGQCIARSGRTSISEKIFVAIEEAVAESEDDHVLAAAIIGAFSLFDHDRSNERRTLTVIAQALQKGQQLAIHAGSELFGFHSNKLTRSFIEVLLPHLRRVPPENVGTIRNIDFGIAQLLKTENASLAVSLLEELLANNPDKLMAENFPTGINSIRADTELSAKVITRWLYNGARALCKAVHDIVEGPAQRTLLLKSDPSELAPGEPLAFLFVARKAVGYLFFNPVSAASFLISLMHHIDDGGVLDELSSLLFNPLLLDFTGTLREYLVKTSQAEAPGVKERVEKAIQQLDEYLSNLSSVGDLPDLHPSEAQREAYYRHFSQQVSESFKKAQAKSAFLNLVSRSVVLHGTRSIHYVYGQDGSSKRMDMEFRKVGTEMEVPRLSHLDPFGLDYMLRVFRVEQRIR